MKERSELIAWLRGEIVGPSCFLKDPAIVDFQDRNFDDKEPQRRGPLGWRPAGGGDIEEVLYYDRESPHRKYGAGILHPPGEPPVPPDKAAAEAADLHGVDRDEEEAVTDNAVDDSNDTDVSDDFEVVSPDVRYPSTIGISFCVRLNAGGRIIVRLPQSRRFAWQTENERPFPVNGRYEPCTRTWKDDHGNRKEAPMWRRYPALLPDTQLVIPVDELVHGRVVRRTVDMPAGSPVTLRVEVFPRCRPLEDGRDGWLLTVVLRNVTGIGGERESREGFLYQTCFEIVVKEGQFEKYPESVRPFNQLDPEEQSLALLYRESATWGIGHGCATGWDTQPGQAPDILYVDVMPAVQVPSMTPDIRDDQGHPIQLSMRAMVTLSADGQSPGWQSLADFVSEYGKWIQCRCNEAASLPADLKAVAIRHLDACQDCLNRIHTGISLLRQDERVRKAFRLANLAMLLQQISTKRLVKRPLGWNATEKRIIPVGDYQSPWDVFQANGEGGGIGTWRAFQIAFLLMSLQGVARDDSPDREIVDLIWFPTGGGKTEAYLAVMAFYIFHERLLMAGGGPQRDGTNALMRYTLRMLTTQQFQRAASLICAMEFLRRNPRLHNMGEIPGRRLSVGLWIGRDGSPNNIEDAKSKLNSYRNGYAGGNPLVLTECPWCRAEIGRYEGKKPNLKLKLTDAQWNIRRTRGIDEIATEGPMLHCSDGACVFGREHWQDWLPVEVIDERIYRYPPSLVISTADKLAMIAYRPQAGAIFGRGFDDGQPVQQHTPPGLIIQDELHLISGPLGTMYGLYEGVFERLCSRKSGGRWIKPKLIASTATIRGADDQVRALYARTQTQLFPSPGLTMGDSFFGTYARHDDGNLKDGRLYLGIHANGYGSYLTTQVRTFSSVMFRPFSFTPEDRDPWWSLLAFYNSLRELGGAKTLFDSDIRSRLKFLFNRENFPADDRRNLRIVEELTSRLSQPEIVGMMDRLSAAYSEKANQALDACLASNIIEVGVDIDRLSLMGVVGQPKTTAQYIQVTGRVGRRWWERPGLILMLYNPSKSRDRSHFEQFHSYHRRLYERVEPTSATPFALSAIQRALAGVLITWARQHGSAPVWDQAAYRQAIDTAYELLRERCQAIQSPEDASRSLQELLRIRRELDRKWSQNPQEWERFPPDINGEYLILWPGQFAMPLQKRRGVVVPSSMRQVDGSAELTITQGYALDNM